MSNLRAFITADKQGFLDYLDHLIEEHQVAFNAARTAKARNYEYGILDGLRIARRAVDNWANLEELLTKPHPAEIAADIVRKEYAASAPLGGYDKHEYQPDFEKSWNPCKVCGFDRDNGVHS
jgi:hypothetical protein